MTVDPAMLFAVRAVGSNSSFDADFNDLVDTYMRQNPVQTAALAPTMIRFAAAKILLLKSGQGARVDWPGAGACRLMAILLVLFLEENLKHNQESDILGLSRRGLYELISSTVRERKISRAELIVALKEVDREGTVTQLVQDRAMDALWRNVDTRSAYDALVASDDVKAEKEAGKNALSLSNMLARWIVKGRYVLALGFALGMTSGDIRGSWGANGLWGAYVSRSTFAAISISVATFMMIAVYPDRLDTGGAPTYVTPILLCAAGGSAVNAFISYWMRATMYNPDTDTAMQLIHQLFVFAAAANFLYLFWCLLIKREYSWRRLRIYISTDGVIFCGCALLMRIVGPPASYPPGRVDFDTALARGAMSIFVSLIPPSMRTAIARLVRPPPHRVKHQKRPEKMLFEWMRDILDTDDSHVAESARVEELAKKTGFSESVQRVVRRRLANRLLLARVFTMVVACGWFVLADYVQIHIHPYSRFISNALFLIVGIVSYAVFFPSNLSSEASRKFTLPVNLIVAVCIVLAAGQVFVRMLPKLTSWTSFILFAAFLLAISAVWIANAVWCYLGFYSWRICRLTLFLDSLCYASFVALLKLELVPIPIFYHHPEKLDLGMVSAMCFRAAAPGILSLVMNEANRESISMRLTSLVGFHHVTLSLDQVGEHPVEQPRKQDSIINPSGVSSAASPTVSDGMSEVLSARHLRMRARSLSAQSQGAATTTTKRVS